MDFLPTTSVSPNERVEPEARPEKAKGYRGKSNAYMKKSDLRQTKPLQQFKFMEEDNLYCREVGIQNYCLDHECNAYCLKPEDIRMKADAKYHGTPDAPADDPDIIRWHEAKEGQTQYITYRLYFCRMGFGYKLKFPSKGSYTSGIDYNPKAKIEYDKNGRIKLHMPRNHHKIVQEPIAVYHLGANADMQRLYVNEKLHQVLEANNYDLETFMRVMSMLGKAGLESSMGSDLITNYITSYQCKGRESSQEFMKTMGMIYSDYLERSPEKSVASCHTLQR